MVRRILVVLVLMALAATPVFASHAWGTYHWSTTSYPMPLKVGDNVTSQWDGYLNEAIADWNKSTRLALVKVAGQSTKRCAATAGRIEVCNSTYGQNGWLGLAQIWLSGGHISQATAKMNDTYYAYATYNTPGWRDLVMCQEVGHDFGLGHQDETNGNTNLGSCMDYTSYPDGGGTGGNLSNRAPNAHDYAQLESIYNHTHASNSYSSNFDIGVQSVGGHIPVIGEDYTEPWSWGTPVAWDGEGRAIRYARIISNGGDHGHDQTLITEVFWAPIPVDGFTPESPVRDNVK